ncbi:MAG: hypothetical protein ACE5F5_03990 [Acidimicrobiia bacterium]
MVKFYAVSLVLGVLGLLFVILGGTFADNVGRPYRDPSRRWGVKGNAAVGALVGFGMAGMSAEFSPLDFPWPVSLGIAVVAAVLTVLWVRYSLARVDER